MTSSHGLAFVYSIAIGLLIGIERERSHRGGPRQALGSRTFALLAAVGTLTALLGAWVVVAGAVVVGCLIIAGYRRTNSDDPGTTTEVAALAVFLLGVLCVTDARLAAAVAIAFMVLLTGKARIHTFAREVVTDVEIDDAIKFLVIAFVILPLLPDRDIGPYGALNPSHIWLIVVTLTGISWVGYVAVRALGPRRGLLATGLASGFVSATATTASMGRLSRSSDRFAPAVAGAQVASVATYAQLGVIIAVVSPAVALRLAVPLVLGAAVLSLVAVLTYRRSSPSATPEGAPGNQSDGHRSVARRARPGHRRPRLRPGARAHPRHRADRGAPGRPLGRRRPRTERGRVRLRGGRTGRCPRRGAVGGYPVQQRSPRHGGRPRRGQCSSCGELDRKVRRRLRRRRQPLRRPVRTRTGALGTHRNGRPGHRLVGVDLTAVTPGPDPSLRRHGDHRRSNRPRCESSDLPSWQWHCHGSP